MICPNKAHDTVKMNGVDLDGNWVCPKCRLVLADKPPVPALDRGQAALAILQTLLAKQEGPVESHNPHKTIAYAQNLADRLIQQLYGGPYAGGVYEQAKPKPVGEFKCEHPTCNNSAVCKLSWTQSGRAISQYLCAYHNGLHLADLSAVHRAGKGSISGLEHV